MEDSNYHYLTLSREGMQIVQVSFCKMTGVLRLVGFPI